MLAIILLTTWGILPFFVWFPASVGTPSNDITYGIIGVMAAIVIAITSVAYQTRNGARIRLLRYVAVIAAISTAASFLLAMDIRFPKFEIPTPHVLASALGVDGEIAYDADVFEIYCELWLCVAGVVAAVILVMRKMFKRLRNKRAARRIV
jgi:hypothetical protein